MLFCSIYQYRITLMPNSCSSKALRNRLLTYLVSRRVTKRCKNTYNVFKSEYMLSRIILSVNSRWIFIALIQRFEYSDRGYYKYLKCASSNNYLSIYCTFYKIVLMNQEFFTSKILLMKIVYIERRILFITKIFRQKVSLISRHYLH